MKKETVKIKRIDVSDIKMFRKLVELFQEVFEEKDSVPDKKYLREILAKPGFNAFVAMNGNEVVGGITAFELPKYSTKGSELFIYDVAVKKELQRKGVGKQLIKTVKEYCKKMGIKEIFVAANEEDKHALKFYKSTKAEAERVVHFNYSVN